MNKQRGFTLIELMIVVALLGILAACIGGFVRGPGSANTLSDVMQGKECIAGYVFVTDANQNRIQVMGANGPVPCQN